jgi:hypothetical protein
MNRRILVVLVVLAAAAGLLCFFVQTAPSPQAWSLSAPVGPPGTGTVSSWPPPDPQRARPADRGPDGINILPGAAEIVRDLNAPSQPPERDLEIVGEVFACYRRIFKQNPPGGLNAEIVAALLGANEKKLAVLQQNLPALNAKGEVVDRWGTPFYFHPALSTEMEILSAGPDRQLWTDDDIGTLRPVTSELH